MKTKEKPTMGRPPKYSKAEDLVSAANKYFEKCDLARQLPEKAGLCLALGITRETYSQYKKGDFSDAIKGFELYIESNWVRRLGGQAATGAIFYLKNAFRDDFKDRNETDVTSGGKPIPLLHALRNNDSNKKDSVAQ